ncbi:hypothetical protein [Corynebacterium sp.]|uniref:hypothetical protein n=1 Tax=Corynebacterium sp. TaxID=1720 RepID=UPI0037360C6E
MANTPASIALRVIPGAYILNSGIGKLKLPEEASAGLHQAATSGISAIKNLPAKDFSKYLGGAEVGLGAALLAPFVSNKVAGAGLVAFGSGLLTMYFNNEENTESDGIRPSQQGLSLSKDSWLVALGLGLLALPNKDKRK